MQFRILMKKAERERVGEGGGYGKEGEEENTKKNSEKLEKEEQRK